MSDGSEHAGIVDAFLPFRSREVGGSDYLSLSGLTATINAMTSNARLLEERFRLLDLLFIKRQLVDLVL